ncbi:glutamate formiminotransferase [Syntrophus gentianae]|uniref:glutamate formimidoyltransferase n=1 Tax=Syntrophus gentianae TaxID=43775 RepID=A0A1H8AT95_9BACT|nr:glutamate formimidoyltransferase [Syntrophus gentianae]SEM73773.1 glutamate formiminotransferase [Syntrophus gentianae]
MKILECVPNFSEGRNRDIVEDIISALTEVPGIRLLDHSMDPDHHRSVVTFVGFPEEVVAGALAACNRAAELIDMRKHEGGVHPRIGAVDVVPFIPLADAEMSEAVGAAHRFGAMFGVRNRIPVYFYGASALSPDRRELPDIRRGGYESLEERLKDPKWRPDAGPALFNAQSGATAVGARIPLVAFNVVLNCSDLKRAEDVARSIRQSSGGLRHVKAIGVHLKSRGLVQVSMNLTDYRETSMRRVFDEIQARAGLLGIEILESELIGLIPQAALDGRSPEYFKLKDFSDRRILENCL